MKDYTSLREELQKLVESYEMSLDQYKKKEKSGYWEKSKKKGKALFEMQKKSRLALRCEQFKQQAILKQILKKNPESVQKFNMKITLDVMKKLGFEKHRLTNDIDVFFRKDADYPFNHITFHYIKKSKKIILKTDNTQYNCSTLFKLIASVFFAGMNYGKKQKIQEVKKTLEIFD